MGRQRIEPVEELFTLQERPKRQSAHEQQPDPSPEGGFRFSIFLHLLRSPLDALLARNCFSFGLSIGFKRLAIDVTDGKQLVYGPTTGDSVAVLPPSELAFDGEGAVGQVNLDAIDVVVKVARGIVPYEIVVRPWAFTPREPRPIAK